MTREISRIESMLDEFRKLWEKYPDLRFGRKRLISGQIFYSEFYLYNDCYVLLYKKLKDVHGRYRWPRNKSEVKAITWQQFDWLMSGLDIEQPKAIQATLNP